MSADDVIPIDIAWMPTDRMMGLGGAETTQTLRSLGIELQDGLRLTVRDLSGRFPEDVHLSGVVRPWRGRWVLELDGGPGTYVAAAERARRGRHAYWVLYAVIGEPNTITRYITDVCDSGLLFLVFLPAMATLRHHKVAFWTVALVGIAIAYTVATRASERLYRRLAAKYGEPRLNQPKRRAT